MHFSPVVAAKEVNKPHETTKVYWTTCDPLRRPGVVVPYQTVCERIARSTAIWRAPQTENWMGERRERK